MKAGTACTGAGDAGIPADYQLNLFDNERRTADQALTLHRALQAAGRKGQAARFALDYIMGRYNRAGLYRTLLEEWLPGKSWRSNRSG